MLSNFVRQLWHGTVGRSQFLRFALVGVAGFVVDAGVVTLLTRAGGIDPYSSRVVSFVAAATATWWLNRNFTFKVDATASRARQWLRFVVVNAGGALINYGTYVAVLQIWATAHAYPAIGVAFGSITGLAFNFPASKYLVFRDHNRNRTELAGD